MKVIELCQYTLKKSLEDTGEYYEPYTTAQEIIDNLNKGGKTNGRN